MSESTRADLLSLISPNLDPKISVVPEGVDPAFAPGPRADAARTVLDRFGISTPYFLFVGTIEPRKNLPRLVRAFQAFRAAASQPDVGLVIGGSPGWLSEETDRALAEAGPSVKRVGRVGQDDLIALLRGALGLILVSLYEGFGLPVLEAMACGTPVLAANRGALPELVGDAGILADPENEAEVASGLARLWDDLTEREQLARKGLERAKRYRWTVVAGQTAEVYRQAAACAS